MQKAKNEIVTQSMKFSQNVAYKTLTSKKTSEHCKTCNFAEVFCSQSLVKCDVTGALCVNCDVTGALCVNYDVTGALCVNCDVTGALCVNRDVTGALHVKCHATGALHVTCAHVVAVTRLA